MNVQNCLLNILHHYGINVYITNKKRDRFSLFFVSVKHSYGDRFNTSFTVHFSAGTALTVFNKHISLYFYRYTGKKQMFIYVVLFINEKWISRALVTYTNTQSFFLYV